MPWEETTDYIRSGHKAPTDKCRTIVISKARGIKAINCEGSDGKWFIQSFLFAKKSGWTMKKAKEWFSKHKDNIEHNIRLNIKINSIPTTTKNGTVFKLNEAERVVENGCIVYKKIPISKESVMNGGYKDGKEIDRLARTHKNMRLFVTENHPFNFIGAILNPGDSVGWFGDFEYDAETTLLLANIGIYQENPDTGESQEVLIAKIDSGELSNVSIGFYSDDIAEEGEFVDNISGETMEYDRRETRMLLNHLALLPTGWGACNEKRGCGFTGVLAEMESLLMEENWEMARNLLKEYERPNVKNLSDLPGEEHQTVKDKLTIISNNIKAMLQTFEKESGLIIENVRIDRGDWSDKETWEEHMRKSIADVRLSAILISSNAESPCGCPATVEGNVKTNTDESNCDCDLCTTETQHITEEQNEVETMPDNEPDNQGGGVASPPPAVPANTNAGVPPQNTPKPEPVIEAKPEPVKDNADIKALSEKFEARINALEARLGQDTKSRFVSLLKANNINLTDEQLKAVTTEQMENLLETNARLGNALLNPVAASSTKHPVPIAQQNVAEEGMDVDPNAPAKKKTYVPRKPLGNLNVKDGVKSFDGDKVKEG